MSSVIPRSPLSKGRGCVGGGLSTVGAGDVGPRVMSRGMYTLLVWWTSRSTVKFAGFLH